MNSVDKTGSDYHAAIYVSQITHIDDVLMQQLREEAVLVTMSQILEPGIRHMINQWRRQARQ